MPHQHRDDHQWITINEVKDVCDVKGMHQAIFYGDYGKQLRDFCQLLGIEAAT